MVDVALTSAERALSPYVIRVWICRVCGLKCSTVTFATWHVRNAHRLDPPPARIDEQA